MHRPFAFLAALFGVLAASVVAIAADLQRAVLELIVNGSPHGDVFVFLREGDVLVPLEALRLAGLSRLKIRTEQHGGIEHVSLRAASPPLSFVFDEAALTISVMAPPRVLARTRIDLSASGPADMRYAYNPSFFVNYAPRLVDGRFFQVFGETGLSLGSALAETSAAWDSERGATRLTSRALFDDRKHLRTAALGDSFVSAGPLGGAMMLGGLSVTRNYELDPYLVKVPRLGLTGSAMAPSTLDVYVNDVLVRRVPVQPGEFELANLAPVTGAGTARYVLRDAYGQEQRVESSYYASSSVLAPGMSEYAYGLGLARENFGTESFDYGEPAAVARYRLGITDQLTSGAHAEFDRSRVNAGSDVTLAGQFGEVELHTALSVTTEQTPRRGSAGLVSYGYRRGGASLRTFVRGTSPEFSTLTLDPGQDRSLVEHATATGLALGSRLNVGTEVSLAWRRDAGPAARFLLTASSRLTRYLRLHLRASRSNSNLGRWGHDLFATLSWSLPARHFFHASGHVGDGGRDATLRISRSLMEPKDIGYQMSWSEGASTRVAVNTQAQASFGKAGATYTNQDGEQHTIVEFSGSVVTTGGGVYFTRATNQSFAVLEVPGVPNVRGYLNNREQGTTSASGRLFLPGLAPYQANRLRIDQADLPLDYVVDTDEVLYAPPTRGGAIISFGVRAVGLVRGSIARRVGDRSLPLKYGDVVVVTPDAVLTSPLGEGGEFELEGLPHGTWLGTVRSGDGLCAVSLQVPANEEFVKDLGAVVCEPSSEKGAE